MRPLPNSKPAEPPFTPEDVQRVWSVSLERARGDAPHPDDAAVHAYLERRGLAPALRTGCVGILPTGIELDSRVSYWLGYGHRVVAPLFDLQGNLASIQSRRIFDAEPKTRFPKRAPGKAVVFANSLGIELLRGEWSDDRRVLLGEGLTDSLTYAMACPYPALCAPGGDVVESCIGPWVKDRILLIAVDCDQYGERVVQHTHLAARRYTAHAVHRVTWPEGAKDACATLERVGLDALRTFLSERGMDTRRSP